MTTMPMLTVRPIKAASHTAKALAPHRRTLFAASALGVAILAAPQAAWADCIPSGGTAVTCTGTAGAYSSSTPNVAVTVASGATVAAPLAITGAGSSLSNAGTITGAGAFPSVQYGSNATITNTGTISSTGSGTGPAAISAGTSSTVTNNGSLTAVSGTPVVEFGPNGSFVNSTSATAAVTGNVVYGTNLGANVGSFSNTNAAFGVTGSVVATGNLNVYNDGLWSGAVVQTSSFQGTTVKITNDTTGTFTGGLFTQDPTVLVNNATGTNATSTAYGLTITGSTASPSQIGNAGSISSFTNNGNATIGSTAAPTVFTVYGGVTQTANGTLNLAISPATTTSAGTTYSQLYAAGSGGTASLAGTINLNVAPGFYGTGTTYQLVLADQGITNNGVKLTGGGTLPFVTFAPMGVVTTVGTQQAYEVVATHTADYSAALAASLAAANVSPATTNELATAAGLNPLIPLASAATSGNEAGFLGAVDIQNYTDARTFLDSVSPQGYYAYAIALRDQSNNFARQIDLRMLDQNSRHDEDGWWGSINGQFHFGKNTGYNTKSSFYAIDLGYDYSGPHHVYGLAFNYSSDSLAYAPGTLSGHNRDVALAAYAGVLRGPLHLSGQVQWNFGHLSANKTILFNQSSTPAPFTKTASAAEHLLKATGQVGFQLKTNSIQLEPFVGIDYVRGAINGFTESGLTLVSAAETVGRIDANRTDLIAGVSLTRSHGVFRPYLRAVYRSRMSGAGSGVTAAFDGLTGAANSFTVLANAEAKHEIDTNAGINWVFDDAGSLFVGYQNILRNGLHSHGFNVGVRIEF